MGKHKRWHPLKLTKLSGCAMFLHGEVFVSFKEGKMDVNNDNLR